MIKIRKAEQKDIHELSNLFDQYRVFYQMDSHLKSAEVFINERLEKKDSIIFLIFNSAIPCGFIQIYPAFSSVAMQPTWILNDLYISKNHRKQGCARALMNHVQTEAKKEKIFSVKLSTAIDNNKAKALYESLNYKKVDAFDNYSLKI